MLCQPEMNRTCHCGFPFSTAADNYGQVKCPDCKHMVRIRELIRDFEATPAEKIARLREIGNKFRKLHSKWLTLPELERNRGEGEEMAKQLNLYHAEAKKIMGDFKKGKKKKK